MGGPEMPSSVQDFHLQNSQFIAYVDESGDHSLNRVNAEFPLFILSFCLFRKEDFFRRIVPSVLEFKFRHFGHDCVVLHEAEIRKQRGAFSLLRDPNLRGEFLKDLTALMESAPFSIIATVIRKDALHARFSHREHVYHLAMGIALESMYRFLAERGQSGLKTHVVVECRGAAEDKELELEFRRICDGRNGLGHPLPFEIIFADKKTNSSGLQMAELVARPIGRMLLDPPGRLNRAWEIIERKMYRSHLGPTYMGWGLRIFPATVEGPCRIRQGPAPVESAQPTCSHFASKGGVQQVDWEAPWSICLVAIIRRPTALFALPHPRPR